ncbi:unnamed protein product [Protopolystoma xenopodis]|uniref:Fibronectin type-III domain-containing protein n=1 Tax=Protopolystoma xenopodis TaxID=117903 RepID=A0A3S5CUT8_9PLAT|nr:unnamed protein product [Protopolystoma xenopodis]
MKTTKLGAVLSDLSPGTWLQFRLVAVSSAGPGGWGPPSRPMRVLTPPQLPSPPRNLTEGTSRIYDNRVDVSVNWVAPLHSNMPLKKYQDATGLVNI